MKAFAVSLICSVVVAKKKPETTTTTTPTTTGSKSTVPPCLPCINQMNATHPSFNFCSDGSCVPSNSTCNANATGPIYTQQSGCKALTQCPVGNNGFLNIGEIYGLNATQGGVPHIGNTTLTVPINAPCAMIVQNPNQLDTHFNLTGTGLNQTSVYALHYAYGQTFYEQVNASQPIRVGQDCDQVILYVGSTNSKTQSLGLNWGPYRAPPLPINNSTFVNGTWANGTQPNGTTWTNGTGSQNGTWGNATWGNGTTWTNGTGSKNGTTTNGTATNGTATNGTTGNQTKNQTGGKTSKSSNKSYLQQVLEIFI